MWALTYFHRRPHPRPSSRCEGKRPPRSARFPDQMPSCRVSGAGSPNFELCTGGQACRRPAFEGRLRSGPVAHAPQRESLHHVETERGLLRARALGPQSPRSRHEGQTHSSRFPIVHVRDRGPGPRSIASGTSVPRCGGIVLGLPSRAVTAHYSCGPLPSLEDLHGAQVQTAFFSSCGPLIERGSMCSSERGPGRPQ